MLYTNAAIPKKIISGGTNLFANGMEKASSVRNTLVQSVVEDVLSACIKYRAMLLYDQVVMNDGARVQS